MRHSLYAALLLLANCLPAADLIVQPGNPAAYQTLQAAVDAAQPGDRILLAASVPISSLILRKSVTIEPLGTGRVSIDVFGSGFGGGGIFIQTLTPGIPLVLRRLDLRLYEMGGIVRGIETLGTVPGEVFGDELTVERSAGTTWTVYGGWSLADLRTTSVWLRNCQMSTLDMHANFGCIDLDGVNGTDALVVTADTLRLEGCVLRGSSANHLNYSCCFPSGTSCTGQHATAGRGGAALRATTRVSLLVDCELSDGNGGTVSPGPWTVPVVPGVEGVSVFGGQTGSLAVWATTHERGLPGLVGNPHAGRGTLQNLGAAAPLSIGGSVTPGGSIDVTLTTPGLSVLLGGVAWGEQATQLGTWWVDALTVLQHPGNGATLQWALPAVPALRGVPVVLQAVRLFPQAGIDNPSGVRIR